VSRAFNRMAGDLAAMERERAMVLAGISHDLRTPLSRLRLALEMSGADPGAAEGMGEDMEEIDKVIAQFLAFAKGEDEPQAQGDLDQLLAEIADGYAKRERQVSFRRSGLAPLRFAPLAIRRAVSNLVDNALRYAGGEVEIAARREGDRVVLEVLDRGPGVPAGEVERLKRPFTRLDEARSGPGGAGLGLAIVERIARAHGGSLELSPRAGGGLAARLSLSA
jgi:two-component system, OmpR family, osmolarity sensor histidine kinase EnvZ